MVDVCVSQFCSSFYSDWGSISIAAAAFSVLASAGLIMLSRLFSLRNLEQIAKTEFVYAASTVLIVAMVIMIINLAEPRLGGPDNSLAKCLYLSSFGLSCNEAGSFNQQTTLIDWMELYMQTPTQCVQRFMSFLYALAVPVDALASVYMEIFMSEHASGFGLKWISERIVNATQSFTFYMYVFFLIQHVFDFVKYYAGFFFSIGVVMRAFPPTRGAGAYVMALSFGLYFVFPLAYITIATLSLPHVQSNLIAFNATASGGPGYACSLPPPADLTPYACGAADVGRVMELPAQIRANADALTDFLTIRIDDFQRHLVHALCIFPMISFVVLLTFVLNATNLFGGNIPEIGRGLVKLI